MQHVDWRATRGFPGAKMAPRRDSNTKYITLFFMYYFPSKIKLDSLFDSLS